MASRGTLASTSAATRALAHLPSFPGLSHSTSPPFQSTQVSSALLSLMLAGRDHRRHWLACLHASPLLSYSSRCTLLSDAS